MEKSNVEPCLAVLGSPSILAQENQKKDRFMSRIILEEAIRRMTVEGWCVLDSVIPPDEVQGVRDAILEIAQLGPDADKPRIGIGGLVAKTRNFAPYVAEERLLGVARARLGTPVRISMTHGIVTRPGYGRANWHGDWPFSLRQDQSVLHPYPSDVPMHITTLWALTEFSSATGGTAIVPGSHRFGNNPSGDNGYDENVAAPSELQPCLEPGDVLMIDSRIWHTNGDNISNQTRVGMAVRYPPWLLKINVRTAGRSQYERAIAEPGQRGDDVIPITPEQYEALPEQAKPLLRHIVIGQKVKTV